MPKNASKAPQISTPTSRFRPSSKLESTSTTASRNHHTLMATPAANVPATYAPVTSTLSPSALTPARPTLMPQPIPQQGNLTATAAVWAQLGLVLTLV